ncbi:MAG TPA: SDR family oxidoreductase [Ktedonobacteraceae bacterium]|jgi:short-subunit dehydrogenase|nr:SDR family oxidoreductase [Ktedonobacteraceae bacterium]
MYTYQGKTALITGASSGIGAAFARILAAKGMHVILLARSEDKLRELADEIVGQFGVRAEVIAIDLGCEGAVQDVYEEVQRRGLNVDLLINNAGFATHGHFETLDTARDHVEIMLNVTALVDLTHVFIPGMLSSNEGAIINVASTAAFQPLPYMAVYGATKAFVVSFSVALTQEYRKRGIRVIALCPGATATNFFNVVGTEDAAVGRKRTPQQVVTTALRALECGQSIAVDGRMNALLAVLARLVPMSFSAQMAALTMRPGRSGTRKERSRAAI